MRMLVTRPEPDCQATLERLAALQIAGIPAPLMTRQTLPAHLPALEGFAAVAVTSANALRALADLGAIAALRGLPLFAVGDRTGHEARSMGFTEVVVADNTFESLATAIALAAPGGPVLYPAGRHLSGDLAHALAPRGIMVVTVPVYEMVAESALSDQARAALNGGGVEAVLLYSRRTAEIFCQLAGDIVPRSRRRALAMLCLSEAVAEPLLGAHFSRVSLADHPSEEAMMALALTFARAQTGP